MTDDNLKILKIFKEHKGVFDVNTLIDAVFQDIKNDLLTPSDIALLELVFSDNPTQEDLNKCLENYDIEVVGGHKALMLAYFMKMHPELTFSDYVRPRLEGLLKFYRFQNLKFIPHYKKICGVLYNNGIKFLIFKGGCIKHLRPDLPRVMGDIDILVPKNNYKQATEIVKKLDYDISYDVHSMDLHPRGSDEGIMDIHQYIILNSDKEKAFLPDLFKRTTVQEVFGINTSVPSNEDLVFISLVNMMRNLTNKTSLDGIPFTLFDCKFLIESKPDFDWNIVRQNAKITNTQIHLFLGIHFINKIVPNLISENIISDKNFENECRKYFISFIFQRYYLLEMKKICHEIKLKDIFSGKFTEYFKLKPKYFFSKLKMVKRNPFLIKLILKSEGIKL